MVIHIGMVSDDHLLKSCFKEQFQNNKISIEIKAA